MVNQIFQWFSMSHYQTLALANHEVTKVISANKDKCDSYTDMVPWKATSHYKLIHTLNLD